MSFVPSFFPTQDGKSPSIVCSIWISARFSEVMWLIEQIMWKSLDKRI